MGPFLLYKTTSVQKRKEEKMEAIEFLDMIYGDIEGYINIVTMDPLDEEETVKSKFVEWPEKRDFAQRYLSMREDENTYCSVGVFTGKSRSGDDEGAMCNVVWAEADTCPPSEFEVEPSLVVRTSRSRTHCWWVLDKAYSLAECSEVARSIYQKHRDKGCDSGWQASKLLRVPGSVNTKYGADYPVRVVENTGAVYTLDEIKAVYPVVRLEEAKKIGEAPPMCDDEQLRLIEEKLKLPSLRSMYLDEIEDGHQSWSQTAKRFQMELFRAGLSNNEVYQLMLRAHCNKYNPIYAGRRTKEGHVIPKRENWELCTWNEVKKFSEESKNILSHVSEKSAILIDDDLSRAVRTYQTDEVQLLSADEVKLVESDDNPTFVKDYIKYGHMVTETTGAFHAALGLVTMATTIGNFGTVLAPGDFGRGLRFWPLILGPSGVAHKTTAVRGARTVIDKCSELLELGDNMVASDSTIQALKRDLGPYHNTSTYMALDEIQDKFHDILDNRGPWRGFDAGLNKLFDCEVEKTGRTTRDGSEKANAHLNVIFSGIYEESIDNLEMRHFKNGFLTRLTWVTYLEEIAREEDKDIEEEIIALFTSYGKQGGIEESEETARILAHRLAARVRELCRTCYGSDDVPEVERRLREREIDVCRLTLKMSDDALRRYAKWCANVMRFNVVDSKKDVFKSSYERLKSTLLQVAGLFSLMDREDGFITKANILNAIYYANHWVRSSLKALNDVTSSLYVKQQENIFSFIVSHCDKVNHAVLCEKVREEFCDLKKWDYDDVISSLRSRGLISGPVEIEYVRGKGKNAKKSKGWFYTLVVDE